MSGESGITVKLLIKIPKDANDCWKWLGKKSQDGYGIKTHRGVETTAARWIWCTLFGELPPALMVIHTCGNAGCVNPGHMKAGTHAEANRNGVATSLTAADVAEIKSAKKTKGPNTANALASRYAVSAQLIRQIWRGAAWGKAGTRGKNIRQPVDS